MRTNSLIVLLIFFCIPIFGTGLAQRYVAGDVVQNFTLVDRATGERVSLYDLEGKIVFLEWFAYWCPFCQAAAREVETGIVKYYEDTGGNLNGVPVIHVGLNLQANAETQTQDFVDEYNLGLVLNDFDRTIASRFQPNNQPIFAIINGVKNSPSHKQWELLYTRLGYGDATQPIETFRSAIDSVEAAAIPDPPVITKHPIGANIVLGGSVTLLVEASGTDLSYQWFKDGNQLNGATRPMLRIDADEREGAGEYSVNVSNPGGEALSEPARVKVLIPLETYLIEAGLNGEELDWAADPDYDGFSNVFEFLAQTNPNLSSSRPVWKTKVIKLDDQDFLELHFSGDTESVGFDFRIEVSAHPAFQNIWKTLAPEAPGIETYRFPFPNGVSELFARIVVSPVP